MTDGWGDWDDRWLIMDWGPLSLPRPIVVELPRHDVTDDRPCTCADCVGKEDRWTR